MVKVCYFARVSHCFAHNFAGHFLSLSFARHTGHIMSFGVHVADDASHPEGEIIAIHDDSAQPVVLTGDDAILGC